MLARRERLPRSELVHLRAKRHHFPYGTFVLLESIPPRGAVVAPKKLFKTAPQRNKVRRRVVAALRILFRTKQLQKSIVVFPDVRTCTASSQAILQSLTRALSSLQA